jgi:hypothetical protein
MRRRINNIIPQMFDVRPSEKTGGLKLKKNNPDKHLKGCANNVLPLTLDIKPVDGDGNLNLDNFGFSKRKKQDKRELYQKQEIPVFSGDVNNVSNITVEFTERGSENYLGDARYANEHDWEKIDYFEKFKSPLEKEKNRREKNKKDGQKIFSFGEIFFFERYFRPLSSKRSVLSFTGAALAIFIVIFGYNLVSRGLVIKNLAAKDSAKIYASLISAKNGLSEKDFKSASMNFSQAYDNFDQISSDIDSLGSVVIELTKYIPFLSKLSSGSHLTKAGKDLSKAGILLSETMEVLQNLKEPAGSQRSDISYLKIFNETRESTSQIAELMKDAQDNLDSVNVSDIPEDKRSQFVELKKRLPDANKFLAEFMANEQVFTDILGGNGPRKYLFLFENNQEMRATGGFIGTYAVLDIFNGRVRHFFVDGIFNPDGQLEDRIVPPAPIQKISANWSMHDSNWWPDFPVSAEKATLFYEKTGGPTVDGVIAITPAVLQKLLEITGPVEMPDYGVTIDKNNFLENIQTEVESNYDKELNQPKKMLSDLAPKILDKIFNPDSVADIAKTMNALTASLNEKHILIYSKKWDIQKVLSAQGWSGEILDTPKDYISVINTNINGYKTDGVVSEKIAHSAEIQPDGSIIDTLTVTRHHNGGNMAYDWWNKVNADYMRVYVPKGSRLLSASGQTREIDSPPLDYNALGYKRDPQVKMEEDSVVIDEESGTRIYEDAGKTVFANWVYVSPQETVEIKYAYLLPFKIDTNLTTKPADTYSLLAQKQSGSTGSEFKSKITYPDFYKILWKYPDGFLRDNNLLETKTDLETDKFFGIALSKK